MRARVIGFGIIAIIALIISNVTDADRNNSGEVTKSGDVSATEVQVGDCFDELSDISTEGSTFSSVHAVPCNEGHHWQAFYQDGTSLESFSVSDVESAASSICGSAAESLINGMSSIKYDAFQNAQLAHFAPTFKSWNNNNDRLIQCLIGSASEIYFTSVFE
jgi:hypothetical protein